MEFILTAQVSKYEFGLFYLLFGRFRLFEIKHIKIKKKKKKRKFDLGFIKYLRAKIFLSYTIATANLTPNYAIIHSMICSLIESADEFTNMEIEQNINYENWGFKWDIKFSTSLIKIIVSFIEYKFKTRKKLFIQEGLSYGRQ